MNKLLLCFCLISCCCKSITAQNQNQSIVKAQDIIPYRPKISEFSFNQLYDYTTRSSVGPYGSSESEVEQENKLKIRLGVPLIINDATLFGVQFKYDHHYFQLDPVKPEESPFFNHLNSENFYSLGGRFIWQQSLEGDRKYTVIAGAEVKSDDFVMNINTTKYYIHTEYTKQLNRRTKIGGGLLSAYSLRNFQVYPLFIYEHEINSKWTMDLKLPKEAILRYKANNHFYISALVEIVGWRYAIHNAQISNEEPMVLRKTDINFGLHFEHEIYDWLWFGLQTGLAKNLRYFLSQPGDTRADATINLVAQDAPYMNFGLYIVPPKKLYLD